MKCAKIYNGRAQLVFCSSNLLFSDGLVAVFVVVFLSSLLSLWCFSIYVDLLFSGFRQFKG